MNAADSLTAEKVIEIAQEEIKRTSEEAVKAALIDISGELAYETEKARLLEIKNNKLELYNKELQMDIEKIKEKNKNKLVICAVLSSAGGVVLSSVLFSILSSLKK